MCLLINIHRSFEQNIYEKRLYLLVWSTADPCQLQLSYRRRLKLVNENVSVTMLSIINKEIKISARSLRIYEDLIDPCTPCCFTAQQRLPSKDLLAASQHDATPSRAALQRPCVGARVSWGVVARQVSATQCRQRPLDPLSSFSHLGETAWFPW